MKRLMLITLIIVMTIGVFSLCGWGADLKIAVLLPGPISDRAWNMMAYNALKAVEKEYNAEIAYTESTPIADFEEIFRGYAQAGYDIVMGHGFQFGDAAKKVAKEFSNTIFIVNSSNISQAPNVASIITDYVQIGFIQGAIAALLTRTNKVAFIAGTEILSTITERKGFGPGIEYINPDVQAIYGYTGSFDDVAKAKEMTKAMAQQGADIITPHADQSNLGVFEAAREEGMKVLHTFNDEGETYPDITITSVLVYFPEAFVTIVGSILEGKFEPKNYKTGVKEGGIGLAPFRKYEVSKEDMAKINQLFDDLKSGKIDTDKYWED